MSRERAQGFVQLAKSRNFKTLLYKVPIVLKCLWSRKGQLFSIYHSAEKEKKGCNWRLHHSQKWNDAEKEGLTILKRNWRQSPFSEDQTKVRCHFQSSFITLVVRNPINIKHLLLAELIHYPQILHGSIFVI